MPPLTGYITWHYKSPHTHQVVRSQHTTPVLQQCSQPYSSWVFQPTQVHNSTTPSVTPSPATSPQSLPLLALHPPHHLMCHHGPSQQTQTITKHITKQHWQHHKQNMYNISSTTCWLQHNIHINTAIQRAKLKDSHKTPEFLGYTTLRTL